MKTYGIKKDEIKNSSFVEIIFINSKGTFFSKKKSSFKREVSIKREDLVKVEPQMSFEKTDNVIAYIDDKGNLQVGNLADLLPMLKILFYNKKLPEVTMSKIKFYLNIH